MLLYVLGYKLYWQRNFIPSTIFLYNTDLRKIKQLLGNILNGEIGSITAEENDINFTRENIGVRISRTEILSKLKDRDIIKIVCN